MWRKYANCVRQMKVDLQKYVGTPENINPLLNEPLVKFGKSRAVDPGVSEAFMFHGTSFETAVKVALEGFDFRLKQRSLLWHGNVLCEPGVQEPWLYESARVRC